MKLDRNSGAKTGLIFFLIVLVSPVLVWLIAFFCCAA